MRSKKRTRILFMMWLLIVTPSTSAGVSFPAPIFTPQPAFFTSTIGLFGDTIEDSEFVDLLGDTILDDANVAKVKNATFLFQQCFSGGILDEISQKFASQGDFMPYVAAAGAAWNQPTKGPLSRREVIARGGTPGPRYPVTFPDFWTAALLPALNNPTISMYDAVGASIIGDRIGTFGPGIRPFRIPAGAENGQRITQGGAQPETPPTFKLRDPEAQSFHAVLLAGTINRDRYLADIGGVYDAIESQWGDPNADPNVSVSVLFGNGVTDAAGNPLPAKWNARSATKANLMSELQAIEDQLNRNEQFFLYVSDHGDLKLDLQQIQLQFIAGGGENNSTFSFPEDALVGYAADEDDDISILRLDLDVLGSTMPADSLEVWLNDTFVTSALLSPGPNTIMADVPEDWIAPTNDLSIRNMSVSPVQIQNAFLDGPAITTHDTLADDLPDGEVHSIFDGFDQLDEFGNPRMAQLSASLSAGRPFDFIDQVNVVRVPVIDLTRRLVVQVSPSSPMSPALAEIDLGTTQGVLELSLTQAQTGEGFIGTIFYKLDTPALGISHRSLGEHPMITLALAEPIIGDVQGQVAVFDHVGGFASATLEEVSSSGGLLWRAMINGNTGGTVDSTNAIAVALDFLGTAQSDVFVRIDSIAIEPLPEPSALLVSILALVGLAARRSRETPATSGAGVRPALVESGAHQSHGPGRAE